MISKMLLPPMIRKGIDTFYEKHPEFKDMYLCDGFRDWKSAAIEDAILRLTEEVASIGYELRCQRDPVEPDLQTMGQCISETSVKQIEEKG